MPKLTSTYVCQQCGYRSQQFLGRCPECGTWNSLVETVEEQAVNSKSKIRNSKEAAIIDLAKLDKTTYPRISTGLGEFDRVLGGGIVLGSVVLVSGDPGIGKSTLLTQLALNVDQLTTINPQRTGKKSGDLTLITKSPKVLYIAGEESAQQIKIRVDRIKPGASLQVLNETEVDVIGEVLSREKPSLAIIDSIQTLETADLNSVAGSVGQVRECTHRLQQVAKSLHLPIFIVGHVTKEGTIAGPKTLEHVVDVVLSLEGDPQSNFRMLRTSKNRFGATDEVGVFEMEESGLIEIKNPSKIFIEQRTQAPGSAVVATLGGQRPLLVEIQALVTKSFLPSPRRTGSGVDNNRLQLLVAVLSKRLGLPLYDQDIFVNVTGGLKVLETAADLGICLAIASSLKDTPIDKKAVLIGEVGLLGELRPVRQITKRIAEAKKLGFTQVISPEEAGSLSQAVKLAFSQVK